MTTRIRKMRILLPIIGLLVIGQSYAEPSISLYAAGSLKNALNEVAQRFEESQNVPVSMTSGPSGLLRGRIEKGEAAQVFASANMKHPRKLVKSGLGKGVALFARNKLCVLAQNDIQVDENNMLDVLLSPDTRLGTSTPKADPSGDYAWELFAKAETIQAGAQKRLEEKALQLTGGPDSAPAPKGRNQYGWVMENDRADLFLTYCTNALLAKKQVPSLKVVQIPPALSVGADYGLTVLDKTNADAWRLAFFVLSEEGQHILASYGFSVSGVSNKH